MIVEMRIYTIKFGSTGRYFDLYRTLGQSIQWRILGEPLGYYSTEIGALNQIVHLWRYSSFEDRVVRRARLWQDAAWLEFVKAIVPLIVAQENRLMLDAPLEPVLTEACA